MVSAGFLVSDGETEPTYKEFYFGRLGPSKDEFNEIQALFDCADVVVGFNLKFDLTWVRNYGISFDKCRVFDCQLAQFVLTHQQSSYPSLNSTCECYELGTKLDVVKLEYWDIGIDTSNIPKDILLKYQKQDVLLTYQVYLKQQELLKENPNLRKLVSLQNQDLLVLQEMEWNGLLYNFTESRKQYELCSERVHDIDRNLAALFPDIPINWNSGDHLSCVLYGGNIIEDYQAPIGHYKTGDKAGQVKLKWFQRSHNLPRLVEPIKGSELKKEGFYATNEATLLSVKPTKQAKTVIELVQKRAKIEKLASTYFKGLCDIYEEMEWTNNLIHGTFNQCVARTGRLSSSKPNLQNIPPEIDLITLTRF